MALMQYIASRAKGLVLFGVIFFSTLLLGSVFYIVKADTANLNLKLTITMPPQCTFSNGNTIKVVNFEEVQQGLIDGVSYKRMPIDSGVACTGLEKQALNMVVSWDSIMLNGASAVSTNRTNLGIAIYRDTTRLANGASLNFTYTSPPTLYAVPVKPTGVMLTDAGAFTGQMTITLNYQ